MIHCFYIVKDVAETIRLSGDLEIWSDETLSVNGQLTTLKTLQANFLIKYYFRVRSAHLMQCNIEFKTFKLGNK